MDAVLHNYGGVLVYSPTDRQAIFPGVNFTCSGSIQSWIFGAGWIEALHHSLSYRSGGAVEMDPILKSGTLPSL